MTSEAHLAHFLLFALSIGGVIIGVFELASLCLGRRSTLPGYGWETEVAHLVMNIVMASMVSPLWTNDLARLSGWGLVLTGVALAIVGMPRAISRSDQKSLVLTALTIHCAATFLMARSVWRMSSGPGGAMEHMQMSAAPQSWLDLLAGSFFAFDMASVLLTVILPQRFTALAATDAPRMSIVPHVAMDSGMIVMLMVQ